MMRMVGFHGQIPFRLAKQGLAHCSTDDLTPDLLLTAGGVCNAPEHACSRAGVTPWPGVRAGARTPAPAALGVDDHHDAALAGRRHRPRPDRPHEPLRVRRRPRPHLAGPHQPPRRLAAALRPPQPRAVPDPEARAGLGAVLSLQQRAHDVGARDLRARVLFEDISHDTWSGRGRWVQKPSARSLLCVQQIPDEDRASGDSFKCAATRELCAMQAQQGMDAHLGGDLRPPSARPAPAR